jgi:peptidoglycan/xylan/chitin deacetylase (PgdA/CDA1 family)
MSNWLPPDKRAAVCFSIDDIHPAKSTDYYEAGGDLGAGALGHLEWLLERHPWLRVTLFVTADWMEISPAVTRRIAGAIPYLRDRIYLAEHLPAGTMRLDCHPEFVRYVQSLPRTEVALHGLHHLARGRHVPREFENARRAECVWRLTKMTQIFRAANLDFVPGLCPPGWSAPLPLLEAMVETGLRFIASARDIITPVAANARTNMSGLRGVSLLRPEPICRGALLHIPTNWQATSSPARAGAILECGGLLSIKAHIVKNALGHISPDGLDEAYRDALHDLFLRLESEFGDTLWWTSMAEIELQRSNNLTAGDMG